MPRNLVLLLVFAAAAAAALGLRPRQESDRSDRSYAVGFEIGERTDAGLERDGVGVDLDLLFKGFADGLGGAEPLFEPQDMEGLLEAIHREMESRRVARLKEQSPEFRALLEENLQRSRAFHEVFGRQDGVITQPDGVQYLVLRHGPVGGRMPRAGDTVVIDLKVQRLDNTVLIDNDNAVVRLDDVVPGGAEVLQLMTEGDRYQVAIPPALAFGEAGRHPDVGPNETLVGIVELREVRRP